MTITPSWPCGERGIEHRRRRLGVLDDLAGHAQCGRRDRVEGRDALRARAVEQVRAIGVQDVEEHRGQRDGRAEVLDAPAAAEARRRDLERVRPAVRAQGDRLAVEHGARHVERERGLDDLGHARGDVVERAGEDGDVVAVAVDLDPRAVELPLDRRRVDLRERRGDVRGGLGEHRLQRPADRQAQGREPRLAVRQRDRRHRPEIAAEHERPPHRGELHVRAAFATASVITPASAPWRRSPDISRIRKGCSASPARPMSSPSRRRRSATEPGPAHAPIAGERGVDRADRQVRGPVAGVGRVAQRRPADADLPLAQLAGQERDARGYLLGRHAAQRRGEVGDLLAARGRPPDDTGGFDEVGQEHNPIVPEVLPLDTPSVCSVPE